MRSWLLYCGQHEPQKERIIAPYGSECKPPCPCRKATMIVLGIETSCDETGIALYDSGRGLLADALYSQTDIHARYGGIIPELASRDHIRKTLPLVEQVLAEAGLTPADLDGIAYTAGPGLVGALLVGACLGRAMAMALGVPAIGVHHMEGHLLAPMLQEAQPLLQKAQPLLETRSPEFPFLALLVSGGHTQLVAVAGIGQYEMLGESVDDAAGEAFDKVAKMLGLPYPGGPHLAKLAERGASGRFDFPRPMTNRPGLDFSFSGLKTRVRETLAELSGESEAGTRSSETIALNEQTRADIARSFEEAIVDTLVIKCRRGLEHSGLKSLVIAGGVSANQRLRQVLGEAVAKLGARLYYAAPHLCTDNGAMIAYAGCQRLLAGQTEPLAITARPRWALDGLPPLTPGRPATLVDNSSPLL